MTDQKNLILAIVLCVGILLGWQLFIEGPRLAEEQARLAQQQAAEQAESGLEGLSPEEIATQASQIAGDLLGQTVSRDLALQQGDRVRINTPRLHGSISLTGARLDDLTLADYRETIDPTSPEIVLLSPREAPSSYYADFGWLVADPAVPTPGPDTLWSTDRSLLEPGAPVTLRWDNGQGLLFERIVAVDENYMFTVTQRVTNTGDGALTVSPYGRVVRHGTPDTLGFFILHEGPYGVFDGALNEHSYDDIVDEGTIAETTTGGWLGFTDKYWLVALIPDQQTPIEAQFTHRLAGSEDRYFATFQNDTGSILAAGATVESTTRVFAGAKEVRLIDAYEQRYGIEKFDRSIDFGWFYFLTKPFFYALKTIHDFVGNFGVAILIFTVIIKLVFFPLANISYRSMAKMKALQPHMKDLQERYKDDRQKMQMELMELYKREKVNPMSGCLPILIQIPVFFALYKVLFVTIEMRHAPFFGWIQDLSVPDPTSLFNLFGLIPWDTPSFLTIGVWPLIMGITMYLQQKLNPAPTDPIQAKVFLALPFVFTFLLAGFPAGLVIYWAWNNTLSILQQWVIMKRMGVKIGGGMEEAAKKIQLKSAPPAAGPVPAGKEQGGEDADDGGRADISADQPAAPSETASASVTGGAKRTASAPAPRTNIPSQPARRKKGSGSGRSRSRRKR